MREEINKLNKRDKEIMTKRYGLDGNKPETLENIGKDLKGGEA